MKVPAQRAQPNGSPLLLALDDMFTPRGLEQLLDLRSGSVPASLWENALHRPLAEFLARPSKEFRARLVQWGYVLGGGVGIAPVELALSVEALHAGSLVVDDIQDGSQERRGAPALHLQHGVARALNAGNWLYFWPQVLLDSLDVAPAIKLRLLKLLGMTQLRAHYGQALDLSVDVTQLPRKDVEPAVQASTQLKTGALVELAAGLGAAAAGAPENVMRSVSRFGRSLGVGLQMLDDLGSICTAARRAKAEEDLGLGRLTWPWAWLAEDLDDAAFAALQATGAKVRAGQHLASDLAAEMAARVKANGRARAGHHLRRSLMELSAHVGAPPVLKQLEKEIERLQASYG